MLGEAAVVPEEGEEMGSVWSGFSMEEVLPSGWMWQLEAGHQSPWNQGRTDVVCLEWRSSGKTNREVLELGLRRQPQMLLICHRTSG